jgi:hypothetical protein
MLSITAVLAGYSPVFGNWPPYIYAIRGVLLNGVAACSSAISNIPAILNCPASLARPIEASARAELSLLGASGLTRLACS